MPELIGAVLIIVLVAIVLVVGGIRWICERLYDLSRAISSKARRQKAESGIEDKQREQRAIEKKRQARIERRLNQRREKARQEEKRKEIRKALPPSDRSGLKGMTGTLSLNKQSQEEMQTTMPPQTVSDKSGLKAVAGMSSLKKQLQEEVVEIFQSPAKFRKYGISIPNGILLFGPPGCGKTFIARQLASELKCYFSEVSPSDIADSYVHGTTMRIRKLFEEAISKAPSVLFIDEFEALVPVRDTIGGHNQYKAEEVNEFLARMGTCSEMGVLLIAASNAPWTIDPAVQRSGRLDKKIYVGPPDQTARGEILAHHLTGRYTIPDLRTELIAETLTGYSSSDLKLLVDEAAKLAVKSGEAIGEKHLNSARELVPPSVLPRIEAQYEHFRARGGNTLAAATAVGFRSEQ